MKMKGLRLLVVEDDVALALMWTDVFLGEGAQVLGPCATAAHALSLIRSDPPELALLDIQLRDGDVYPVASALQSIGVPFVFLSNVWHQDLSPTFSHAPFLQKPTTVREVFAALLAARPRR